MASSRFSSHSGPPDDSDPNAHSEAASLEALADQVMDDLGGRVSSFRRAADQTLASVAEKSELSAAYISQIESGVANPTVRALAQVAAGLDLHLSDLFGTRPEEQPARPHFEPRFATVPQVAITPGAQGIWDLSALGSGRLAVRLIHGTVGDHADLVQHPGEEFLVVLAGRCRLHIGKTVRDLKATDGCHLDASSPHQLTDLSDDLLLLAIFTEE